MRSTTSDQPLRPSVLDRLTGAKRPSGRRRVTSLAELRRCVARDLEWLLNTRVMVSDAWRALPEARDSVLTYGVPDFATASWTSSDDRNALARALEAAIQRFEPRLSRRTVQVQVLSEPSPADFRLRYRISGVLHIEPVREPVVYDTEVNLERSSLEVHEVG